MLENFNQFICGEYAASCGVSGLCSPLVLTLITYNPKENGFIPFDLQLSVSV
jgi:hypothetical protein